MKKTSVQCNNTDWIHVWAIQTIEWAWCSTHHQLGLLHLKNTVLTCKLYSHLSSQASRWRVQGIQGSITIPCKNSNRVKSDADTMWECLHTDQKAHQQETGRITERWILSSHSKGKIQQSWADDSKSWNISCVIILPVSWTAAEPPVKQLQIIVMARPYQLQKNPDLMAAQGACSHCDLFVIVDNHICAISKIHLWIRRPRPWKTLSIAISITPPGLRHTREWEPLSQPARANWL